MKKVRIRFPQMELIQKTVEVSDEEYSSVVGGRVKCLDFIWSKLDDTEREWSMDMIDTALEMGHAWIKPVNEDEN